jgi:opacity protein-like surface antigen
MKRSLAVAALLLLLTPASAFADLTAFLGRATSPETRTTSGFAVGAGLLIVGFEFEYGSISERLRTDDPDVIEDAPEIKTYMFNGLLQTPVPIARMQFYGTLGGGVYHETLSLEPDNDETNFGTNIGGGAKITLAGPLRVRLDYRVFNLRGTPRHSTVQRFYVGVNLKF